MASNEVPDIPALLASIEKADRDLAVQTTALKNQLSQAENRARNAELRHAKLVAELESTAKEVTALKELVNAREDAHRAQDKLVQQLKLDNASLRQSYMAAAARSARDDPDNEYTVNRRHVSVTIGGNRRDMSFSDAELAKLFVENQRLENVGVELVKQVETQKTAHHNLTTTVNELMTQLQEENKEKEQREITLKSMRNVIKSLESSCGMKDGKLAELQRALNKLQAEYNAVSVAHSYSNAELVKLKMKIGKKNELVARDPRGRTGGVLGGVENLLHRRK